MASQQYEITADQYRVACNELAKLDKLASKLNLPRINIYVDKREWVQHPVEPDQMYERLTVTVLGSVPVIDGWQYVATIQHEAAGNIVRFSPFAPREQLDLTAYRAMVVKCDHCGLYRNRKDTYVVRNVETGQLMQVSSSCLQDFVRTDDPHALMQYIEFITSFRNDMETAYDPDGYPRGGFGASALSLRVLMEHTFCMVEQHGWLGKQKAREQDRIATVDRAMDNIERTYRARPLSHHDDPAEPIAPRHAEKAVAAIEWIRAYAATVTVDQRDDYMHSLCVATAGDTVEHRTAGIAASLAYAYTRHLNDEQERKQRVDDAANVHVATVGSKLRLTDLTITQAFSRDNDYGGVSFTYILKTPAGTSFKWTTAKCFERGDVLAMNVTIKEHTEYKGWKQTVITRCTKIDVVSQETTQ